MMGGWAGRGNGGGEGDTPAPRAHGGAAAGDSAEADGRFDRHGETGEPRRVTGGPHDGTGGPRGGAGGPHDGAGETATGAPGGGATPAGPPPQPEPPVPALLQPLSARLRRTGMPPLAATWCTVLTVAVVLAGLSTLAANRVSADYPRLQTEVKHTTRQVQASLAGPPFHINSARIGQYSNQLAHFLSQHKSLIAGTVVTGGKIAVELVTGLILTFFVMFFLLKDGERIWAWLVRRLSPEARQRADNAGGAAWTALVNYMRGTTAIAAIHAVVIGLALFILGVPLLVPLTILGFLPAYGPLDRRSV